MIASGIGQRAFPGRDSTVQACQYVFHRSHQSSGRYGAYAAEILGVEGFTGFSLIDLDESVMPDLQGISCRLSSAARDWSSSSRRCGWPPVWVGNAATG
jgi:hypothetical protein